MLFVEIDEFGKTYFGLSSGSTYYTGYKAKNIAISFDLDNNYTAAVYKPEDNVRYTVETYNTNTPRYIVICRSDDGIIKFRIDDNNGNKVAVLYPTNSNSSLSNTIIVGQIRFGTPGNNPFFYMKGYDTSSNLPIYQIVYGSGSIEIREESALPQSYTKHVVTLNEIDYDTKVELVDLIDTTSDLASRSAAKYVSR